MPENKSTQTKVTTQQIQDVMALLFPLPGLWLLIVLVAILLSMFEVTLDAGGAITATFRLNAVTALLLALIWLPVLLRVIALAGGGIKTAAGEVSTPGLRDLLVNVVATLDSVEVNLPADQRQRVQAVKEQAERQVASLSPGAEQARDRLKQLARDYEELRSSMPAGSERTYKMTSLVAEARALAGQAGYSPEEIRDLFKNGSDGERIIALALIQANPRADLSDVAIQAVGNSRSAFEQYQGLRIIESLAYVFDEEARLSVIDLIQDQRRAVPGKHINRGTDRWQLSERILSKFR